MHLLPGVRETEVPPRVVCDSRRVIVQARRNALLRDSAHLLLVAIVDWMFVRWPASHVPMLDRYDSLAVLGALNGLLIGYVWVVRMLPRWSARRIASTWCITERSRFLGSERRQ